MRKITILAASAALLAAGAMPAAGEAKNRHAAGSGAAHKACKAERDQIGKAAFTEKYANENGKRAMKRCVRARVKAARTACRTERNADKAAFKAKYANKNGKHSFKRCVRQHADD